MTSSNTQHSKRGAAWVGILLSIAVVGMVVLIVLQVMESGSYKGLWPA